MSLHLRSFEDYRDQLSLLGGTPDSIDPATDELRTAIADLLEIPEINTHTLAAAIDSNPAIVPVLGLVVGLTQEQLRNRLRHRFQTSGWITLARTRPSEVIAFFEEEFGITDILVEQRHREFDFADILVERSGSRRRAGAAIQRGRSLEDDVAEIVHDLELGLVRGTRFIGRANQDAPCDLAIPGDGTEALIVCAIKGFDSTGSKLSDAVREIQEMAQIRLPRQFVFAVVDGIGWLNRQADLRRIWELRETGEIDGLYTKSMLSLFRTDLDSAARRLGLL